MEFKDIEFSYDKKNLIIKKQSFAFNKNEITSIIGPNGCGKTTLLNLLCKQYKSTSGVIYLNNKEINKYKGKEFAKEVASVYQINDSINDITVENLVSYGRVPHKSNFSILNDEDYEIINNALERTSLTDLKNKKICNMSGGERQRVYVALALCQEPSILFLDEPTSFLDMYYQQEVLNIVKKINLEKKITVIMVLHDVNQALLYSDNIIIMKDGEIKKHGKAKEIITKDIIKEIYDINSEILTDSNGIKHFIPIYDLL